MAELKIKLYMPGPLCKQMIFAETTSPYFSGYITNGKNKIKVRSPFETMNKDGLHDFFVEEGKVSDEDIDTIFKSE